MHKSPTRLFATILTAGIFAAASVPALADRDDHGHGHGNRGGYQNACSQNQQNQQWNNRQNQNQNRGNGENRGRGNRKRRDRDDSNNGNCNYGGYNNGGYNNGGYNNGANGNSVMRGTITAVNGNEVTLSQGYGSSVTIDDQPALDNRSTGRVSVGRYVTVYGYRQNGVFYATRIN